MIDTEKARACQRRYRAVNREKILARKRLRRAAYLAAHPEKVRAEDRRRYAANREKFRERARLRYVANREKIRAQARRYRAENLEKTQTKARHAEIRRKYGMSPQEYSALLDRQGGCCPVCEKPLSRVHVDHDHAAGRVRGLLHGGCNVLLGHAKDTPFILENAARYLERHAGMA